MVGTWYLCSHHAVVADGPEAASEIIRHTPTRILEHVVRCAPVKDDLIVIIAKLIAERTFRPGCIPPVPDEEMQEHQAATFRRLGLWLR